MDKKKAYLKFKEVRVCVTETGGTRGFATQEDVLHKHNKIKNTNKDRRMSVKLNKIF